MYVNIERKLTVSSYNQGVKEKIGKVLNFYTILADLGLKTKDSSALQIKLKWYMLAIEELYEFKNTHNKDIDCLQEIVKEHKIPKQLFINILEARAFDGDKYAFKSFNELLLYAKNTSGALWQIIAYIITDSLTTKDLLQVEKTGTLFGLIGVVRNARYGRVYDRYFLLYNKEDESLYKKISEKNTKYICEYVLQELKTICCLQNKNLKKLLLLNIFTKFYVKSIKRVKYQILEHEFRKVGAITLLKFMFFMVFSFFIK